MCHALFVPATNDRVGMTDQGRPSGSPLLCIAGCGDEAEEFHALGTLERGRIELAADSDEPIVRIAVRGVSGLVFGQGSSAQSAVEIRPLYNPERRTAVFIVPGPCGVILTLTMVLFTSIAVVRERERGNLELLITTPVCPLELMTGEIIPYIFIGYVQISLILFLGFSLFDMPIHGSFSHFYLGAGVFVISILSLGLFISTAVQTQFQAFQMTFMSFLPQMLLSGFMFPFEGMPRAVQILGETFPLTHCLRVVRGVVLRDAHGRSLAPRGLLCRGDDLCDIKVPQASRLTLE